MRPKAIVRGVIGLDAPPVPVQLKVLMASEDVSTAKRAKFVVESALGRPEVNAQLQVQPWEFDLLGDPELGRQVVREASNADILVVAMHGRNHSTKTEIKKQKGSIWK